MNEAHCLIKEDTVAHGKNHEPKYRDEYLEKMRDRYHRRTGRGARTVLLDEFCDVTGHERKYANKLLSRLRGPNRKGATGTKKRGVGKTYPAPVIETLFEIWKQTEQPCGKRLASMLPDCCLFLRSITLSFRIRSGRKFSRSVRLRSTGFLP